MTAGALWALRARRREGLGVATREAERAAVAVVSEVTLKEAEPLLRAVAAAAASELAGAGATRRAEGEGSRGKVESEVRERFEAEAGGGSETEFEAEAGHKESRPDPGRSSLVAGKGTRTPERRSSRAGREEEEEAD